MFFGDSLWAIRHDEGAPALLDDPDELAWLPDRGIPTGRLSVDECVYDEVVETQIIGGIQVSDIASVIFDQEPPTSIMAALEARKIACDVNPLAAMPSWLQSIFIPDQLTSS